MTILTGYTNKQWLQRTVDERTCSALSATLNPTIKSPNVIARLLTNRGINSAHQADIFLCPTLKETMPNPFVLKDMDKAVKRIQQALISGEKIAIFGDYDVDGATSSAILKLFFLSLKTDTTVYIPDRIQEGYGPNVHALEKLAQQGCTLIITVDCGTTSFIPLEAAKNLSLDVIVIDHHKAEAKLPYAAALINPCRLDDPTPELQNLAAVGLCFLVIIALNKTLRDDGYYKQHKLEEPDLHLWLDIVALGTVADVVKLQGLNRTFVAQGLKILRKRVHTGLSTLCDVAGITQPPDAYHLGFILGPRINAGGRVGQAKLGTQLLTTQSFEEAETLAQKLNIYNKERQNIEAQVLEEAIHIVDHEGLVDNHCLIVGGKNWHPGVIGIVASRLKEKYQRPCAVVSYDDYGLGKASGRSIEGVDFGKLIHQAKHEGLLEQGGGHAMAVGFSFQKDKLVSLTNFFNTHMAPMVESSDLIYKYDMDLSIDGATFELIDNLEHLAPFGMGNPTPKFRFPRTRLNFSGIVGEQHIKCRFAKMEGGYVDAIAFRCVGTPLGNALLNSINKEIDVIGTLRKDSWMGKETVKLHIDDVIVPKK